MEALYQLKDRLLARDRDIMFQDRYKLEEFIKQTHIAYMKQWLNIWTPYFQKGIKLSILQVRARV